MLPLPGVMERERHIWPNFVPLSSLLFTAVLMEIRETIYIELRCISAGKGPLPCNYHARVSSHGKMYTMKSVHDLSS